MLLDVFARNKLVWTAFSGITIACVAYFSIEVIKKWSILPILLTTGYIPVSINDIPFPAVTICSETKLSNVSVKFKDLYQKNLKTNLTEEDERLYGLYSLVCDNKVVQYTEGNLTIPEDDMNTIIDVHPSLVNTCYDLYWDGVRAGTCREQLKPSITEEGICYTFNAFPKYDIYKDNVKFVMQSFVTDLPVKKQKKKFKALPKKTFAYGAKSGIGMILGHQDKDQDFLCKVPVTGFKVSLHFPGDVATSGSKYIRVPADQEVLIGVKPKLTKTSKKLRSFLPEDRHCYFSDERNLTYFKEYSQKNCEFECLVNVTLEKCQCVAFYMPRFSNVSLCGSGSIKCVRDAQRISTKTCNCMQSCNDLQYEVETSTSNFEWVEYFRAMEANTHSKIETMGIRFSKLNIFFVEPSFQQVQRLHFFGYHETAMVIIIFFMFFTGFTMFFFVEILLELGKKAKEQFSSESDLSRRDETSHGSHTYTEDERKMQIL